MSVAKGTSTKRDNSAVVPTLIETKLRPPRLRPDLVGRTRLLERLRAGRQAVLTLVCAPAGYGKSTLLAQWAAEDSADVGFAWVSLETADSDPIRLWAHVISGLRRVHPTAGEASLPALAGGPRAIPITVVPLLLQELSEAPPVVLVLDDWQLVKSPICDATMTAFVEHAPESIQVVVSTRADPALPIARLRAHGELVEVRESALRISNDEAADLFRHAEIDLDANDVQRLNARTEGWLAGLCLALIVVRDRADRRRFVEEFSGDTRHVLDYLSSDVLDAVPSDMREFLLRSSVLDRMTAEVLDAVLERSDSADMLAEIERGNLFVVALDEKGREFRYHHLFQATLARELEATAATSVPDLHRRAAKWFAANGNGEAAIEHAIASHDTSLASDFVTGYGQQYWASGRIATVVRWLEDLSWPEALADPQLALIRAHLAGVSGQPREAVEGWLELAETAPDSGPLANGFASLRCGVAILRATYLTRGLENARQEALLALELQPDGPPWQRLIKVMLAQALYLLGRSDEALQVLDAKQNLPGAFATAPATALGMAYRSLILHDEGDAAAAARIARSALDVLGEQHLGMGLPAANPLIALGTALGSGPDVISAREHLERAVELTDTAGLGYWKTHALLRLAAVRLRLGDREGAKGDLVQARADLDGLPDTGMLERLYEEANDDLAGRRRRDGYLGEPLSEAEQRVLQHLVDGLTVPQVAHELWLSPNTVKTHRRSIYRKLGASDRDELLARAAGAGVTPTND